MNENDKRLQRRVHAVAQAALARRGYVSPIDVLSGLDWLPESAERAWREGRIPYLERAVGTNLSKISKATHFFRSWATAPGLKPSHTAYVAATRDRRPLRFNKSGKSSIERAYQTHWIAPGLSERERLAERARADRPSSS